MLKVLTTPLTWACRLARGTRGQVIPLRCQPSDAAVVFVHGFTGSVGGTWAQFTRLIIDEPILRSWDVFDLGYSSHLRVDIAGLWAADPDIVKIALGLRTAFSLTPLASYKSLAVVAHSMGGLAVQRAILDDPGLAHRLSHVILFGTPSEGLVKAQAFAGLKRQVKDMEPGGQFITSLRRDWNARFPSGQTPFVLRVAAGDRDEFVPADSSLKPFPDVVKVVVPGNHVQIVRPVNTVDPSFRVVADALGGQARGRTAVDGARVAVETGNFQAAVRDLLPNASELDPDALASLALALESLGRGEEALELLEAGLGGSGVTHTDVRGVLAGRLKRRWLTRRAAYDLSRSKELYLQALRDAETAGDHGQAYYHAINAAFLELMSTPFGSTTPAAATDMARRALTHCAGAPASHWRTATYGEAHLILGDLKEAAVHYREAIRSTSSPRELDSLYSQAVRVAARVFGPSGAEEMEHLFLNGASP